MKTLYVTDLDGTLLNSNSSISPYTLKVINQLVEEGIHFTYATARSLSSASIVTKGLSTKIPVIAYNGTIIFDASNGEILASNSFTREAIEYVKRLLTAHDIYPLVYSFVNKEEKVSWVTTKVNEGMKHYLSLRQGDRRLRPLPQKQGLYDGNVFYFTCIGEPEELAPIYDILSKDSRYTCTIQQELNRTEYWCEIMPRKATKAEGVKILKELYNFDYVISFGDAINDIPMFEISDEAYAVANAVDTLKEVATGIIRSNDEDGVAKCIQEFFKKPMRRIVMEQLSSINHWPD